MKTFVTAPCSLTLGWCTAPALADQPTVEPFGKTKDGTEVELYTIKSGQGLVAKVLTRVPPWCSCTFLTRREK